MKVKFLTNLGTRDATELGLDHAACVVGVELDVTEATALKLASRGFVQQLEQVKPVPEAVNAVPENPAIAEVSAPAVAATKQKADKPSAKSSVQKDKPKEDKE